MALKKKGTPAKIEIVVKESELEQWKKLLNDSVNNEPFTIITDSKLRQKNKKNKA